MTAPDIIHIDPEYMARTVTAGHMGSWREIPDSGDRVPYIRLHGEALDAVRAAVRRQVENIERWRETGIAAGPDESREIYEGLRDALAKIGGA